MYQINIESDIFKGVRTIQQHRMVNDVSPSMSLNTCIIILYNIVSYSLHIIIQVIFILQALGEEVKSLHGLTLKTGSPTS